MNEHVKGGGAKEKVRKGIIHIYLSTEDPSKLLKYFVSDLALGEVLSDEGMLEDVLHHHAIIGVLLHDAEDEALGVVTHIHVLWKLDLVLDLNRERVTIRLRSSYE